MQIKLYDIRKNKKHLTQQVAEYLGISTKSYRDKELSRHPFTQDEMFKLSSYFGMKMEDIFYLVRTKLVQKEAGRRRRNEKNTCSNE